jgi:hypothetical protein
MGILTLRPTFSVRSFVANRDHPGVFSNPFLNRKCGIGIERDVDIMMHCSVRAQFLQNPFFKGWDPEVLDVHIQHGLADIPASEGGGVRLKMSSFRSVDVL